MPKRTGKPKRTAVAQEALRPVKIKRRDFALQEVRHIVCPVCSLVAREEFIEMGPYMAKRRVQQFGGSSPSATGEMRHRPGVMLWSDPASLTPTQKSMLKDRLTKALEMLEGAPTSAAEVMVHAVARREKPTKVVIPKAVREEEELKKELRLPSVMRPRVLNTPITARKRGREGN